MVTLSARLKLFKSCFTGFLYFVLLFTSQPKVCQLNLFPKNEELIRIIKKSEVHLQQ